MLIATFIGIFADMSDNPDVGGNSSAHGSVSPPPQALNFGSAGSGDMGLPYMTTESLLRKIQALLKAAADKIRDDDRALNFEKGKFRQTFIHNTDVMNRACWSKKKD